MNAAVGDVVVKTVSGNEKKNLIGFFRTQDAVTQTSNKTEIPKRQSED